MNTEKRLALPDIVRTFCFLEIVAFWHLLDYVHAVPWKDDVEPLTKIALASFTFISGLFLGKKEVAILTFYQQRLKRFYPLLLVALMGFCISGSITIRTYIYAAIGLSCFIPPQPPTLWFFAMMILFYIVTPFLLLNLHIFTRKKDFWRFIMRCLILYSFFISLSKFTDIDIRVLENFPFYVLGILVPVQSIKDLYSSKISLTVMGTLLCLSPIIISKVISDYLLVMGGVIILFCICSIIEHLSGNQTLAAFRFLSYISMSAYLFHRHIFLVFHKIYHVTWGGMQWWQAILMLPFLILFSFLIQRLYDYALKKFF